MSRDCHKSRLAKSRRRLASVVSTVLPISLCPPAQRQDRAFCPEWRNFSAQGGAIMRHNSVIGVNDLFQHLDGDDRARFVSILFQPIGGFNQLLSCSFFSSILGGVRLHGGK
jgi:hypothetical protein